MYFHRKIAFFMLLLVCSQTHAQTEPSNSSAVPLAVVFGVMGIVFGGVLFAYGLEQTNNPKDIFSGLIGSFSAVGGGMMMAGGLAVILTGFIMDAQRTRATSVSTDTLQEPQSFPGPFYRTLGFDLMQTTPTNSLH